MNYTTHSAPVVSTGGSATDEPTTAFPHDLGPQLRDRFERHVQVEFPRIVGGRKAV